MPDGRKVTRRIRTVSRDLYSQVNEIELVHHVRYPDGHQDHITQRIRMRYFFRYEVEHLVDRSGFRLERLHADYDRSPFGSKYPGELIVIARKK